VTDPTKTHPLRAAMDGLIAEMGGTMKDWTIQTDDRDPFRMDKPGNHRDCSWLREAWESRDITRPNHDRGVHYSLIGEPMPAGIKRDPRYDDGRYDVYGNTVWHSDWSERAMKIARWLGHIPWDWVKEERNRDPIRRIWVPLEAPDAWIYQQGCDEVVTDLRGISLPSAESLRPRVGIDNFEQPQPFQIAIFGEKTSLFDILDPIAKEHNCHLFLAKGDLTNPLVYDIARVGGELDLRPMQILYFSDSDPSGWNMPKVLAVKLIALKMIWFPEFEFQIHRVGLIPTQVKEYKARDMGLTESPLKEGESRADDWYRETGTFQTEIDSLITFYPQELQRMAVEAIGQFRDPTLDERVFDVQTEWRQRAMSIVDEHDDKAEMREAAVVRLAEIDEQIQELADEAEALSMEVAVDLDGIELPPEPELPDANLDWHNLPEPLVDSRWEFVDQMLALLEAKAFRR
jgi:hypothetical protein